MLCRLGLSGYNTERLIVGVNVSENCTPYTSKITFVDFENKNTVSPFESHRGKLNMVLIFVCLMSSGKCFMHIKDEKIFFFKHVQKMKEKL
jgi:hypothetical protein